MILVTGGAGFIGSNILAALEERGAGKLVACDRLRSGNKWRNIAKRELADIVPPEQVFAFLEANRKHMEVVIHMGAISATTETDADKILTNNFSLSQALWKWCTMNDVRFIYASSAATYGDGAQGFDDDWSIDHLARLRPLNAYGWSKHLFDRRVSRKVFAGSRTPPQWAGLKFFNVYGPNEYHKGNQQSVVAQVYPHAEKNAAYQLFKSHNPKYADGGQLRDFIWIGDVVNVVMWLLENPKVNGVFNVGTGQARSFLDLANSVYRAVGREPQIKFRDTPIEIRDKYQYFTQAKMDRLHQAGYSKPFTSLEDGVAAYVKDFLSASDPYR
jgi:ADP-L-glycero-D-manno-heptose 6-epimerase